MSKIDLSNKGKDERRKMFESYIKGRLFHSKQTQIIDVKSLKNKFKVTHLKDKDRVDSFLQRMLIHEIYPLQLKLSDEYRMKKIKHNIERNNKSGKPVN